MANPNWVKGVSGNPKGRPPKEHSLTDALRRIVNKDELGRQLWALAQTGDMAAIKYVYDRIDGQPKQSVDLNAEVEGGLVDFWREIRAEREAEEDSAGVRQTDGLAEAGDS